MNHLKIILSKNITRTFIITKLLELLELLELNSLDALIERVGYHQDIAIELKHGKLLMIPAY